MKKKIAFCEPSRFRISRFLRCLISVFTLALSPTFAGSIALPVEVALYSGSNHKVSKTVSIPSGVGTINRLWMRVHNLRYDNQMSVRVNGSSWTKIGNNVSGVSITGRSADYGGIGGGFTTHFIEVNLPNGTVTAGNDATVEFRHNASNGVTSAFRVNNFNFLNSSGQYAYAKEDVFFDKNPDNFNNISIANNASNRNAGKALWEGSQSLIDQPGGVTINASCSDCHTRTGADLKYFGFTNNSIKNRSRFHGLTANEAEKIALYIRTLSTSVKGRPWNPPYQPSAGMSSKSVNEWAAGGGFGAILDRDRDMLSYLFPNGTGSNDIEAVIDTAKTHKTYDTPVAIQLPDWNQWLPEVAPQDVWSGFENAGNQPYAAYLNTHADLTSNGVSYYLANASRRDDLLGRLNAIEFRANEWLNEGTTSYVTGGSGWRALNGNAIGSMASGITAEFGKRYLAKWMAVKYFEIMTEYELEDKADEVFDESYEAGESRGWPTTSWAVFAAPPHINSDNTNNYSGQDALSGEYESSAWYQLGMILSNGFRARSGVKPMDWEYQFRHVMELGQASGVYEPLRYFQSLLKGWQARDNGAFESGWEMRVVSPYVFYSDRDGDSATQSFADTYESGLWNKIMNAFLAEWVEVTTSFDLSTWPRIEGGEITAQTWYKLPAVNAIPEEQGSDRLFTNEHHDAIYRALPRLYEVGVDADLLYELQDWAMDAWPQGDWETRLPPKANRFHFIVNKSYGSKVKGWPTQSTDVALATSTGDYLRWKPKLVSDAWYRVELKVTSGGVPYWLQATNTASGSGYKVKTVSNTSTGSWTQWRFLPAGYGYYRMQSKKDLNTRWMRGYSDNKVLTVPVSDSGEQTKWQFLLP